ncbi:MAG TPA: transglycosylase domain-containing protein, partial [Acidobacteriota bacterium]|nr:transglycosylase domain-containing protein [Acidobacteriota bacterium]
MLYHLICMLDEVIETSPPVEHKKKRRVFRTLFIGLLYFLSISIGSLFGFFLSYLNRLPQIQQIENYQPSIPTHVYSADGKPIDEFYVEKRVVLRSMDHVSPDLRNAIIAVEDAHYFEHPGVDPWGILRALYVNLKTGRVVEGGSTITQQLAKMLFLRPEKTMERKILEAMLAVQLERKYTKQELFLFYCNQIYLGHGVYGVEAAAHYYFGKPASQLNVVESAMIAALPKAPQEFSPHAHPQRALQRRNHVLSRMLDEKFITRQVYEESVKAPLGVVQPLPKTYVAPYFTEEIRKYLEDKYGYAGIYESGLEIYSTLDVDMQKAAGQALDKGVRRLDKKQGWREVTTTLTPQQIESFRDPSWTSEMTPGRIVKGIVIEVTDRLATVRIAGQDVPLLPDGWAWTRRKTASAILKPGNLTDFKVLEVKDGKILSIALDQVPHVDGAFVAMELKTGKIKALIGGSDF